MNELKSGVFSGTSSLPTIGAAGRLQNLADDGDVLAERVGCGDEIPLLAVAQE